MGYVLVRAALVGITFDEIWTLNDYVIQDWFHIINYTPAEANNHMLNTLGVKFLFLFLPENAFVARLPNVLAFGAYLYFSYQLCSRYLMSWVGLVAFILLLANPFLLDFFGLCRGYGLALGFQMGSIFYLVRYVEVKRPSLAFWSLLLGALAVASSFTMLNYWLAIAGVINVYGLVHAGRNRWQGTPLYTLLVAVGLFALLYEPLRKLQLTGRLFYGGHTGFYSDTLVSLTKYSLYSPQAGAATMVVLNVLLFLFLLVLVVSWAYQRHLFSIKHVLLGTTLVCVAAVWLQHQLLGTLFVIDRAALFFYPLLILVASFSLNGFAHTRFSKLSWLIVGAFCINMLLQGNFNKTAIWYFDAHSRTILAAMNEEGKQAQRIIKLDYSWPVIPSVTYYFTRQPFANVMLMKDPLDRERLNPEATHYIYLGQSLEKVGYNAATQTILQLPVDTLLHFERENIIVLRIVQ